MSVDRREIYWKKGQSGPVIYFVLGLFKDILKLIGFK